MVDTDILEVGQSVHMIADSGVVGKVHRLRTLGQKKWFKVMLDSGNIILVQNPELWTLN